MPTPLYPTYPDPQVMQTDAVTLTTTRFQEIYVFVQPNSDPDGIPLHRPDTSEVFNELDKVKVPILFIAGGLSDVSMRFHKKMEILKHAELIIFEDAGHLLPFEQPVKTADFVSKFLGKVTDKWMKDREVDRAEVRYSASFGDYYINELGIRQKNVSRL